MKLRFLILMAVMLAILLDAMPVVADDADSNPTQIPPATSEADLCTRLECSAKTIKWFDWGDFLYDRLAPDLRYDSKTEVNSKRQLSELVNSRENPLWLESLLSHKNPRVRTLAMAALFARDEPVWLPQIAKLAGDNAKTFPSPGIRSPRGEPPGKEPKTEPLTVGMVATSMMKFYLEPAGYYYGVAGDRDDPGFTDYWEKRGTRTHCASWFLVKLQRASTGSSPVPKDRIPRIREIRRQIDALPPAEAAMVLLYLRPEIRDEDVAKEFASQADLVRACEVLGRKRLLAIVSRKPPTDDPDLQPRSNGNFLYKSMCGFILGHGVSLLKKEDAETLLACEAWERDHLKHRITDPMISPMWAIAAAKLDREHASQLLHEAMARFNGRYDWEARQGLAVALWNQCGEAEAKNILDWFYGESSQSRATARTWFLEACADGDRTLFRKIIQDDRFSELDWASTWVLVRIVNKWVKVPLVSDNELRGLWHPLGLQHYDFDKRKAAEQHPKESELVEKTLSDWRAKLKASLSDW